MKPDIYNDPIKAYLWLSYFKSYLTTFFNHYFEQNCV